MRVGPAGGLSSCCIVPWISASYGTDERGINFHTRTQSSSTYLRFLLVEFTSDLLNVRFDSLSKGYHLDIAHAPAERRTCLLESIPIVGSHLFSLPAGLVSPRRGR